MWVIIVSGMVFSMMVGRIRWCMVSRNEFCLLESRVLISMKLVFGLML